MPQALSDRIRRKQLEVWRAYAKDRLDELGIPSTDTLLQLNDIARGLGAPLTSSEFSFHEKATSADQWNLFRNILLDLLTIEANLDLHDSSLSRATEEDKAWHTAVTTRISELDQSLKGLEQDAFLMNGSQVQIEQFSQGWHTGTEDESGTLHLHAPIRERVEAYPFHSVTVTTYPVHNPENGTTVVSSNPLETLRKRRPYLLSIFTEQESELQYGQQYYRGVIVEFVITLQAAKRFNTVVMNPVSDQTAQILRVDVQEGDSWVPVQQPDGAPLVNIPMKRGVKVAVAPVNAKRVRLVLYQPDYTLQYATIDDNIPVQSAQESQVLQHQAPLSTEKSRPYYKYSLGLDLCGFLRYSYTSGGTHTTPWHQSQDGALTGVTLETQQCTDSAGKSGVWYTMEFDGPEGPFQTIPVFPQSLQDSVSVHVDTLYPNAAGTGYYCILPYPLHTITHLYVDGQEVNTSTVTVPAVSTVAVKSLLLLPNALVPSSTSSVVVHYVPVSDASIGYSTLVFEYDGSTGFTPVLDGLEGDADALDFRRTLVTANAATKMPPGELTLGVLLPLKTRQLQYTVGPYPGFSGQSVELPAYPQITGYNWTTQSFSAGTIPVEIEYQDDSHSDIHTFIDRTNYEDMNNPQPFTDYGYQFYLTGKRLVFNRELTNPGRLIIHYKTKADKLRIHTHLHSLDTEKSPVVSSITSHLVPQLW